VDELQRILDIVQSAKYGSRRIKIASETVRGLEYYTGPVFEVELMFSTDGTDGSPRFGSVGGGGRYDELISRFRGQAIPATGFSIGVSRLLAALEQLNKVDLKTGSGPVVVAVFPDRNREAAQENFLSAQRMVRELREAKIRAEVYLGDSKNLGNQFKYADRRNAPCVILEGPEEKAVGKIQIKDLIAGADAAVFHDAIGTSRQAYLEERVAQFTVLRAELVPAVCKILEKHAHLFPLIYGTAESSQPT
jgi:histidyl-tRNA synthetase